MGNGEERRASNRRTAVMFALYLTVIAVGIVIACGIGFARSGDSADATEVAQRFLTAIKGDDAESACALLAEDTAAELEKQERKPCEQAILTLPLSGSEVADVEFAELSAIASVTDGDTLFLGKTSQGWKVAAAGCKPRPGQPYDCELSG